MTEPPKTTRSPAQAAKDARLAQALRRNLRRRKAAIKAPEPPDVERGGAD